MAGSGIIIVIILLVLIIIKNKNFRLTIDIYKTDKEKFEKKYL